MCLFDLVMCNIIKKKKKKVGYDDKTTTRFAHFSPLHISV